MRSSHIIRRGLSLTVILLLTCCSLPKEELPPTPTSSSIPVIEPTLTEEPTPQPNPAEIIFYHGNIITIEPEQPLAQALAVRQGVIQAVGSDEEVLAYQGPGTILIDLGGKTIMPGISDGHSHYVRNAFEAGVPLEEIQYNLLRFGLTGDTEMHSVDQFINDMLQVEQNGALDIRLNIFASYNCGFLEEGRSIECISWYKDNPPILDPARLVRIPGVKIFVDGAGTPARGCSYRSFPFTPEGLARWPELGTACDNPYGSLYLSEEELITVVQDIQDRGYRTAYHAMGDAAIETILDALDVVLDGESNSVYRHQIEHNSNLRSDLMDRYVEMDMIANILGMFNVSEAEFYEVAFGEEHYEWNAYRYALPGLGIHVLFGQDYNNRGDVNKLNPFVDLFGFVTHKELMSDGSIVDPPEWVARHEISVERALEMLTIEPAYAVSMEEYTGSLKPGKYADLIILSADPLTMDPNDLYKITVLMTMVNGENKYCAAGADEFCPQPAAAVETIPAAPTSTPVVVPVAYDCDAKPGSPISIGQGSLIQTTIRWGAVTAQQVQDYIDTVLPSILVDGAAIETRAVHGEVLPMEGRDLFLTNSFFDAGILDPGRHVIKTILSFASMITDGYGNYGPGSAYPTVEGTCTVIVE